MTVTIFGMGYVGSVTLSALSSMGHKVCGIEINKEKIKMLQAGNPPVNETGVKELLRKGIDDGKISFNSSAEESLQYSSVAIICVGTPSKSDGSVNLDYVNKCIHEIINIVRTNNISIAIRSTVPPDYIETHLNPYLASKDIYIPKNIVILANPEFLREGSALSDFIHPPFNIIGKSVDEADISNYINLFKKIKTENITTSFKTAFLVKYASNIFHALKATFTNEIGLVSEKIDADMNEVMNIFCKDKQLNISERYLKNGYAIGGSCLPKDLSAVIQMAESKDISLPLLESIQHSNKNLIDHTVNKLLGTGKSKFGFYGITFKQYTDDLRESSFVKTVELLILQNKQVYIYDDDIIFKNLNGVNKTIFQELVGNKYITFVKNASELLGSVEVLVVTKENTDGLLKYYENQDITVLDLSVGRKLRKKNSSNLIFLN